jgi:hypothetical protein
MGLFKVLIFKVLTMVNKVMVTTRKTLIGVDLLVADCFGSATITSSGMEKHDTVACVTMPPNARYGGVCYHATERTMWWHGTTSTPPAF